MANFTYNITESKRNPEDRPSCDGSSCQSDYYYSEMGFMSENCTLMTNQTSLDGNGTICTNNFGDDLGVLVVEDPDEFKYPWISNSHFYPNILTYLVTMIFGLVGNTAFIAIITGDRKSRTTTNVFLVSLTVADLLMLAVCAPLEIVRLFVVLLNFGGAACRMGHYFMMLSFTSSVLNLTAVSLERFIVIVFPMRARSLCTMSNCRRAVLFVWAISLLLACPIIWVMGEESIIYTNEERTEKVVAHYCRDVDTIVFPTYRLLVLFCIPGVLMIAFYTAVIRELWLSTKNINALTNSRGSQSAQSYLVKSDSYPTNASVSSNSFGPLSPEDELKTRANMKTKPGSSPTVSRQGSRNSNAMEEIYHIKANNEVRLKYPQSSRSSVRFQVPLMSSSRKHTEKGDEVKRTRKQISGKAISRGSFPESYELAVEEAWSIPYYYHYYSTTTPASIDHLHSRFSHFSHENLCGPSSLVIKMLIVIVILFVLCWGPTIVTEMLIGLGQQTFTQEFYVFKWVSSLLPFLHCCINPVIYCFMSKNFRTSMYKALSYPCCRSCCRGSIDTSQSNDRYVRRFHSSRSNAAPSFAVDLPSMQTDLDITRM